jgi:hypothetical protein
MFLAYVLGFACDVLSVRFKLLVDMEKGLPFDLCTVRGRMVESLATRTEGGTPVRETLRMSLQISLSVSRSDGDLISMYDVTSSVLLSAAHRKQS